MKFRYSPMLSQIVQTSPNNWSHYCPANELSAAGKFFQYRELFTI
jgi:hypothetical protein